MSETSKIKKRLKRKLVPWIERQKKIIDNIFQNRYKEKHTAKKKRKRRVEKLLAEHKKKKFRRKITDK